MIFLATGEWWVSNLLFGVVFVVAGIGIVGIGWFVVKQDGLNRLADGTDQPETTEPTSGQAH